MHQQQYLHNTSPYITHYIFIEMSIKYMSTKIIQLYFKSKSQTHLTCIYVKCDEYIETHNVYYILHTGS